MRAGGAFALAGCLAWAGCVAPSDRDASAGGEESDASPIVAGCQRPTGSLSESASLSGRTGRYAFVMIDGSTTDTSASGTLVLHDQVDGLGTWGAVATPIYGTSDIDLEAVGAQRVGDLSDDDPKSPGVLVMEDEGPEGRRIRLRLGSRANTRDL
ncbi:MAG: hypothetical protein ACE5FP_11400, partial [Gemmatimonadota bacterium]